MPSRLMARNDVSRMVCPSLRAAEAASNVEYGKHLLRPDSAAPKGTQAGNVPHSHWFCLDTAQAEGYTVFV
jgi:hypothetical protein